MWLPFWETKKQDWGVSDAAGYGHYVIVTHGGGHTTLYAHSVRVAVQRGETVRRGEVIVYTGPNLHFEISNWV